MEYCHYWEVGLGYYYESWQLMGQMDPWTGILRNRIGPFFFLLILPVGQSSRSIKKSSWLLACAEVIGYISLNLAWLKPIRRCRTRGENALVSSYQKLPQYSKTHLVGWLAIKNKMQTRIKLASLGVCRTNTCLLCENAVEDHNHLFFQCD